MRIVIDVDAAVPVYEQIRSQIAGAIALGNIKAGQQIPPARTQADELGIAVGTVARAYSELQTAGLVRSRPRRGTVVQPPPIAAASSGSAAQTQAAAPADVAAAAQRLAMRGQAAGFTAEQLVDVLRASCAAQPAPAH